MSASNATPKTSFGSHKLERLYYPEGKFSVMLPGPADPVGYGSVNGMRSVEYTYKTFAGSYIFGYLILPGSLSDQAKIQQLYNAIGSSLIGSMSAKLAQLSKSQANKFAAPEKNAAAKQAQNKVGVIGQTAMNICNHPGREIRAAIKVKDESGIMRFRMVVIDRYFYMMIAAGHPAWVDSAIVNEFMNSLSVRTGQNSMGNTASGAPRSIDKKEFDRKMQKSQSYIRSQSEQMQAKMKYNKASY